jgi:hypothetical protein
MAAMADVSIEFSHLYLANLDRDSAELSAHIARRWLTPVMAAYEDAGLTVSTVVMVDDYFAPEGTDVEEKASILQAACQEAGVRVDHIAHEAACAESVEQMEVHLHQEPRVGDGSSSPPPANIGSDWLSNGDPSRGTPAESEIAGRLFRRDESESSVEVRSAARETARGHHSIHLDVQLWNRERSAEDRLWACPTLSAWWQLIRLGMLRDEKSGRPVAPPRTRSLPDAPPLPARRTITLLDSRFIEVEHAVRAILERVSLPEAWRRYLRQGEAFPTAQEHLERIAYIFVPSGFDALR